MLAVLIVKSDRCNSDEETPLFLSESLLKLDGLIKKDDPVVALDGRAFLAELVKMLSLQLTYLTLAGIAFFYAASAGRIDLQIYICAALVPAMIHLESKFSRRVDLRHRLLALYPNCKPFGRFAAQGYRIIPVVALALWTWAVLKNKVSTQTRYPFFFRYPKSFVSLQALLFIGLPLSPYLILKTAGTPQPRAATLYSYWLTSPGMSYLAGVAGELDMAALERQRFNDDLSEIQQNPFRLSENVKTNLHSATGAILLQAAFVSAVVKLKDRNVATAADKTSVEPTVLPLLRGMIAITKEYETKPSLFTRLNPLNFLTAAGTTEFVLLGAIDHTLEVQWRIKLMKLLDKKLDESDAKLTDRGAEIASLRAELHQTRMYASYKMLENSWLATAEP